MYTFDSRLLALAGCAVLEGEGGGMVFDVAPVINAENDQILAHEICHVLAGRRDYRLFSTAVEVRKSKLFQYILNLLYDWYHEYTYGGYSGVLWQKLTELHQEPWKPTGVSALDALWEYYSARNVAPKSIFPNVEDAVDLIALADTLVPKVEKELTAAGLEVGTLVALSGDTGGPAMDVGHAPEKSDYYSRAVARHQPTITTLSTLWKRNKYAWTNNYHGEINWKNLVGSFFGDQLSLAVWRTLSKHDVNRKIYLVIDRSGSTYAIKEIIMDTAVIIAESLRQLNTPISIMDVGVTDSVINNIDSPLDLSWFTPMAEGGTSLGDVCARIKGADADSYLLIITDGRPDSWKTLKAALAAFPGSNLTLLINDNNSYLTAAYREHVRNVVEVDPHTIIRELLNDKSLR